MAYQKRKTVRVDQAAERRQELLDAPGRIEIDLQVAAVEVELPLAGQADRITQKVEPA